MPSPERVAAGEDAEIASAIDAAARAVVSRGMSAPAILLLESSKPVAFLGSQALHFLDPFVRSLFDAPRYEILARALEDRENVERLLVRIEQLEEDARLAASGRAPATGAGGAS